MFIRWICCSNSAFDVIINHPSFTLSEYNKMLLKRHYIALLYRIEYRMFILTVLFYSMRSFVQVGSIISPAILSLQLFSNYLRKGSVVAWSIWLTMVMMGVLTSILNAFSIHKKLLMYTNVYDLLQQEIWSFLQLSSKYKLKTHDEAFTMFCHNMEELTRKVALKENHGNDGHESNEKNYSLLVSL